MIFGGENRIWQYQYNKAKKLPSLLNKIEKDKHFSFISTLKKKEKRNFVIFFFEGLVFNVEMPWVAEKIEYFLYFTRIFDKGDNQQIVRSRGVCQTARWYIL